MSRYRVKVGVAAAGVDGAVTDPNVGEAVGIIRPNGNIARRVGHPIIDAVMPLQRNHGIEVAERCKRVRYASHTGGRKRTKPSRQCTVEGSVVSAVYPG